ncbi:hypothetical protein Hanom_Chr11g00996891 [Helianthus anomalus]
MLISFSIQCDFFFTCEIILPLIIHLFHNLKAPVLSSLFFLVEEASRPTRIQIQA